MRRWCRGLSPPGVSAKALVMLRYCRRRLLPAARAAAGDGVCGLGAGPASCPVSRWHGSRPGTAPDGPGNPPVSVRGNPYPSFVYLHTNPQLRGDESFAVSPLTLRGKHTKTCLHRQGTASTLLAQAGGSAFGRCRRSGSACLPLRSRSTSCAAANVGPPRPHRRCGATWLPLTMKTVRSQMLVARSATRSRLWATQRSRVTLAINAVSERMWCSKVS